MVLGSPWYWDRHGIGIAMVLGSPWCCVLIDTIILVVPYIFNPFATRKVIWNEHVGIGSGFAFFVTISYVVCYTYVVHVIEVTITHTRSNAQ